MRPVQLPPHIQIARGFNRIALLVRAETAVPALHAAGHHLRLIGCCMPARADHALRSRRGATALEFALVGSLLFTFMIGIIEVGRYMLTQEAVRMVTAEAVRVATLRGSAILNSGAPTCQNLSGSLGGAVKGGPMLQSADLSVILSGCATQGGMTSVTVTVTYPFSHAIPLVAARAAPLREQGVATIF